MLDIGNVFSNTFSMMKERWLPLAGLCAVFFGLLIVYGFVFAAVLGGSMMGIAGSMSDPSAVGLAGMGIGFFVMALVFYIGYFAIILGQQGSMIAYASPLRRTNFGDALTAGLKGGLSFLVVLALFFIAYFLLIFAALSLGEVASVVLVLLFVPVMIYLACRFAVLVPVIVVEQVFNPFTAIMRCWEVTRGHALGIFIVLIITVIIAMILLGVPFMLFFGTMAATLDPTNPSAGAAIGSLMFGLLFFVVLYFVYMIFITSMTASLHAEISDSEAVDLGKTFE